MEIWQFLSGHTACNYCEPGLTWSSLTSFSNWLQNIVFVEEPLDTDQKVFVRLADQIAAILKSYLDLSLLTLKRNIV